MYLYLDEHLAGGRDRLIEALVEPDLRAWASQPFLAGSLYDVGPLMPMCEVAATLMGVPFATFVRDFSRQAAENDIRGIYKMLFKLVSPNLIMERVPQAARQYFDFVTATVEKLGPKHYRTMVTGMPEGLMHFYMLVTEAFLGRALTLAGAQGLSMHWLPYHDAAPRAGVPMVRLQRDVSWR
jgi:hypothetical protein